MHPQTSAIKQQEIKFENESAENFHIVLSSE